VVTPKPHCVPPPEHHDHARRARHQHSWQRAALSSCTECRRRRVAIARDEHTVYRPRSAAPRPSTACRGLRREAALGAAAGASRSHETSTPRAVRALRAPAPAQLAEGSADSLPSGSTGCRRRCVFIARDEHALPHSVPSALHGRSPQHSWQRAALSCSTGCRRRCVVIARDEHAACSPRSAIALPNYAGRRVRALRRARTCLVLEAHVLRVNAVCNLPLRRAGALSRAAARSRVSPLQLEVTVCFSLGVLQPRPRAGGIVSSPTPIKGGSSGSPTARHDGHGDRRQQP
jgi:hypothetical protein